MVEDHPYLLPPRRRELGRRRRELGRRRRGLRVRCRRVLGLRRVLVRVLREGVLREAVDTLERLIVESEPESRLRETAFP